MDDLAEFLKKGFQRLHQKTLEKDYKQKTVDDRREIQANLRRKTRDTLMLQKRNIDLNNFTPICTPEVSRQDNNAVKKQFAVPSTSKSTNSTTNNLLVTAPVNKRLEMLKKWKAEKQKRIVEEKKNAKPLFKIYHVPIEVGLPNLENVNKEIKGKLMKRNESFISKFAPDNHKFKPPKNLVPIKIHQPKDRLQKFELRKNCSIKTRSQDNTSNNIQTKTQRTANKEVNQNKTQDHSNRKLNKLKTNLTVEEVKIKKKSPQSKKSEPVKEKAMKSSMARKTPEAKQQPKKGVMWDIVEIIDSDNEILTQEIKIGTPKRIYNKTPVKKKVAIIPNSNNNTLDDNDMLSVKTEMKTVTQSLKQTKDTVAGQQNHQNSKNKLFNENSLSASSIEPSTSSLSSRPSKTIDRNQPRRKSSTKTGSNKMKTTKSNDTPSKITSKKIRRSTSLEEFVVPSKLKVFRKKSDSFHITPQTIEQMLDSSSDIEDNLIIYSRKMTASPSYDNGAIQDKISSLNGSVNEDSFTVNKKHATKKETSLLYSDEEVTLRTPRKKLATPNKLRKSILKSAEKRAYKRLTSTPNNKTDIHDDTAAYISPFVTISRGKDSARKEYKMRLSTGGTLPDTPEFRRVSTKNTSPGAGAVYFAKKLKEETVRIQDLCSEWTAFKEEIPTEVQDMVDAAIGQSKLLISKKFEQFRSLIKLCEDGTSQDRPITCTDLHGYWDTMYMQIEDIDKRFNNLKILKDNDWKEILVPEQKPVVLKKARGRPKKIQAQSRIKDMLKNARLRKNNPDVANENVETPSKSVQIVTESFPARRPSSSKKRKSLLEATFGNKDRRKLSSSPGLTMLRLSQAIKCGDGLTPSKSILKTDSNRSEKRTTKSVLFKDLEEDKENSFDNLMMFSPMIPRRSNRISRLT